MKTLLLLTSLAALTGCSTTTSYVHSDTNLGRVVVYRNGVAYFERTGTFEKDTLELKVPADKVDDFLKSLTVVDAKTGDPAPISYPTTAPSSDEAGLIHMKISLNGPAPHELKVSYVTDAPSWKPSYRVTLGKDNKVGLQAWAIVDNTSGEDWANVQLGVGSSSALSFRYDLRSVRLVQRETLRSDDLFAQAPPMGGASYANVGQQQGLGGAPRVMAELSDETLAQNVTRDTRNDVKYKESAKKPVTKPTVVTGSLGGSGRGATARAYGPPAKPADKSANFDMEAPSPAQTPQANQLDQMARQLQSTKNQVIVEGWADHSDGDKYAASLERANRTREQLIRGGLDPNKVVAIGKGEQSGRAGGVRIVEAPPPPPKDGQQKIEEQAAAQGVDPIGTSHFESKSRMSVTHGTSAMVSILNTETEGEVVYLYDAESPRGNSTFPFRAMRIKNPTDSVLESGPVNVFGEGKFIGEGLADPIPARSTAFVPFALDRQILVERKEDDIDRIARIITVQRGVFSTEVQHTRRSVLTLHNRMSEKATVYVRHTVAPGYKLGKSPDKHERLGGAYLFRAELEPNGKAEMVIEEATPLFKSTDIRAPGGMELVTAYLSSAAEGQLKAAVTELLKVQKEMANIEQRIATMREEMGEYRTRMDELHAQIVTLKVVKTAGPLMQNLEKKLQEVSDKLSKATIDLVGLQEQLMVARIRFQDGVADLSLEKKVEETKADDKPKG
jgi:outer membrane protein OmpA-like peptidoglycan-associated protein/flagellar biosynthesis chaperone FliJ